MSMRAQLNTYLLAIFSSLFPILSFGQDLISEEDAQAAANSSSLVVPKVLREPQTEEELAQQPILLAISQREYKRAEQRFESASQNEPQKSLIASGKFASQLRGLESFWRSIEGALERVKSGDQLVLPKHLLARDEKLSAWISKPVTSNADSQSTPSTRNIDSEPKSDPTSQTVRDNIQVKVIEKNEKQLVLSNQEHGRIEVPTGMAEMPTAIAVALFRFQFPNSNANATTLFERFDFPGHSQLVASIETGAVEENDSNNLTRMEGQNDDRESETQNVTKANRSTDTRLPVPEDSDQKKSRTEIRFLFDSLFVGKTPEKIKERAQKLVQVAKEADPSLKAADIYILLDESLSAAEAIADIDLCLSISSEITNRFQVDPDAQFISMSKNVLSKVRDLKTTETMMGEVHAKIEAWIDEDNYVTAKKALTELGPIIRRLKLVHWTLYVGEKQNLIKTLSKKHSELLASINNLPSSSNQTWPTPDDLSESQCEMIAKFLIFEKGNLEKGLPYLARATTEQLREIAKLELKPPQNLEERIQLAEKWLEIKDQAFAIQRAQGVYGEILFTATGLTEVRIRKKLDEIQNVAGKSPSIRDYLGRTFKITWIYVDGSGNKDEVETLVFRHNGTYRREQPAGSLEGNWVELPAGEISTNNLTRSGCSEGFKLLPGGLISGMHYRGDKPIARCQGKATLQP